MLVPARQVSYMGLCPLPDADDNDSEEDYETPILPRPKKNYNLFETNDSVHTFQPRQMFDGACGELPFLTGVTLGYDPEDPSLDPFMRAFESQEIMFAFKKGCQTRALLRTSKGQTLGIPVCSRLTFHIDHVDPGEGLSLTQILAKHQLPLTLTFARPETLTFGVDGCKVDHTFFGPLTLTRVYEEQYLLCLSIDGAGKVRKNLRVLPMNLYDVTFAKVVKVKGAAAEDQASKLQEFVDRFSDHARQLDIHGDPFVQEMAFVSRHPDEVVDDVQPYMEQNTFIPVTFKTGPPQLPPRNDCRTYTPNSATNQQLPPSFHFPTPSCSPSYTNSATSFISNHYPLGSSSSEDLCYNTKPKLLTKPKPTARSQSFNVQRTVMPRDQNLVRSHADSSTLDEARSPPKNCLTPCREQRSRFYTNTAESQEDPLSAPYCQQPWAGPPRPSELAAITKQTTVSVTHTQSFNKFVDDEQQPRPHRTHGGHNSYIKMDSFTHANSEDSDSYAFLKPPSCETSLSSTHMYTNSEDVEESYYDEPVQRKTHIVRPFVTSAEIRAEREVAGETSPLPRYSDAFFLPTAPAPPLPPRNISSKPFSYYAWSSHESASADSHTHSSRHNDIYTNETTSVSISPVPMRRHPETLKLTYFTEDRCQRQPFALISLPKAPNSPNAAVKPDTETASATLPTKAVFGNQEVGLLTVDGVALKLKEMGLGKYASKFKKNRIDGVILKKLTEDTLKTEFCMKKLEIVKLETFASEGHIPQKASPKRKQKKT